jgi:hypothetical protein
VSKDEGYYERLADARFSLLKNLAVLAGIALGAVFLMALFVR